MKTLYISDLDGTLLNRKAEVSVQTAEVLNSLIDEGLHFSVATARTSATIGHILHNVRLNMPVVLMNGVCIFDMQNQSFVKTEFIPQQAAKILFSLLCEHGQTGFLYTLSNNMLNIYYENLNTTQRRTFYEERVRKYGKKFTRIDSFSRLTVANAVYVSICERKELVEPVYKSLKEVPGLRAEFYQDIYSKDSWYLEVCAMKASKQNAVAYLRKVYGFDRVVCFGDNMNDLPMFEAADVRIAVSNAKAEVKARADVIIGSHEEDSVAKWIAADRKQKL